MTPLEQLRQRALEIALTQIGVREVGGNNRGRQVEIYLASVGLDPGHPWCAAFVYWCHREASKQLSVLSPLPKTGKCVRMWQRAADRYLSKEPTIGAVYVHLTDPLYPDSDGHVGIVTDIGEHRIGGVEGNTNAAGGRAGDQVRVNVRRRDYVHGYIDIGREGPVDSVT